MRLFLIVCVTVACLFSIVACDEDNVTSDGNNHLGDDDMVRVKVDLGTRFIDYYVRLKFNELEYFSAILSPMSLFSGPVATFTTYLPRGSNTCFIAWQKLLGQDKQYFSNSTEFTLGSAEEYFLIVHVSGDSTLVIEVKETFPGYI